MLGEKLMKLRKKSGMSQQDVATSLTVSRQTISNWESNTGAPDIGKAKELAALYHISLDDLVNDEIDVTVVESERDNNSVDLHVLNSIKGSRCRIALTSGLWMPVFSSAGVDVLDIDTDWVRVTYDRPLKERVIELVDMKSIAGFQIISLPNTDECRQ